MKNRKTCVTLLLFVCSSILGCGTREYRSDILNSPTDGSPKLTQIIEKYKPPYAQKREQLRAIAQKLPPAGKAVSGKSRTTLNPPPLYDNSREGNKGTITTNPEMEFYNNTVVIPAEALLNPDDKTYLSSENLSSKERFSLETAPGSLILCMGLIAYADLYREGFTETFDKVCEDGLNRRYLLTYRNVKYQKPSAGSSSAAGKERGYEYEFENGAVDLEFFLVDLQSSEIITQFRISAQGEGSLAGGKSQADLESFLVSSIRYTLQPKLVTKLKETTGGEFKL